MLFTLRFLIDADTQARAQAVQTAAEQAIVQAGGTVQGSDTSRRQATYQVVGVVCDTGAKWTWRGDADDPAAAEALAVAANPPSSRAAFTRRD